MPQTPAPGVPDTPASDTPDATTLGSVDHIPAVSQGANVSPASSAVPGATPDALSALPAPHAPAGAGVGARAPLANSNAGHGVGTAPHDIPLTPRQIAYLHYLGVGLEPGKALNDAHVTSAHLHAWRQDAAWRRCEASIATAAHYLGASHARALLDAGSVGAALRLVHELDEAPHARDRIRAADLVLDAVGLLGQRGAQAGGAISVAQAVILVGRQARDALALGVEQGVPAPRPRPDAGVSSEPILVDTTPPPTPRPSAPDQGE